MFHKMEKSILKDEVSTQIVSICIEVFKDFCRLSPIANSSSDENDAYFRYFSGCSNPFFNGIWWHSFSFDIPLNEIIHQSNSYFNKYSYTWWLDEKTHTKLSKNASFTKKFNASGSWLAMATILDKYEHIPSIDPDITIEEIKDDKTYEIWLDLFISIFDLPEKDYDIFKKTLNDYGPNKPYTHLLAKYKNKSAGIMSLYTYKNIAYICNGAVLKQFRKKGLGTFLGKVCLEKAIDKKAIIASSILEASREAKGIMNRLGFSECFHIYPYSHNKEQ